MHFPDQVFLGHCPCSLWKCSLKFYHWKLHCPQRNHYLPSMSHHQYSTHCHHCYSQNPVPICRMNPQKRRPHLCLSHLLRLRKTYIRTKSWNTTRRCSIMSLSASYLRISLLPVRNITPICFCVCSPKPAHQVNDVNASLQQLTKYYAISSLLVFCCASALLSLSLLGLVALQNRLWVRLASAQEIDLFMD